MPKVEPDISQSVYEMLRSKTNHSYENRRRCEKYANCNRGTDEGGMEMVTAP